MPDQIERRHAARSSLVSPFVAHKIRKRRASIERALKRCPDWTAVSPRPSKTYRALLTHPWQALDASKCDAIDGMPALCTREPGQATRSGVQPEWQHSEPCREARRLRYASRQCDTDDELQLIENRLNCRHRKWSGPTMPSLDAFNRCTSSLNPPGRHFVLMVNRRAFDPRSLHELQA